MDLPHLQNAIRGRGARDALISATLRHNVPTLLLTQAFLPTVIGGRDLSVGHVVKTTLRGQFWELCEEPVTVFEEAILVDRVEIVPVFIGSAVVLLCKEKVSRTN